MIFKLFHPVIQIVLVLTFLTAVFAKNVYIVGWALGLLVAMRLPRGISIRVVAAALALGVLVGTLHFVLMQGPYSVSDWPGRYFESTRLAGIVMIIVVSIMYMNSFTAVEWLEISASFGLTESTCRFIDWMAIVIVMMIRFTGRFIGVAHAILSEVRTRPQLTIWRSLSVFPGMALTYVNEVMRNVEVYADTWDLRFGGPRLRRDSFKRPLVVADYVALLGVGAFILALALW